MFGRSELLPGADVAVSVMLPIPTEWWLRPVSSAARVGAHSAVVWNRLYLRAAGGELLGGRRLAGTAERAGCAEAHVIEQDDQTFGAPSGGSSGSIGG